MLTPSNRPKTLLTRLRAHLPAQPVHQREALRIAERQADLLLRYIGMTRPPVSTNLIAAEVGILIDPTYALPLNSITRWDIRRRRWVVATQATDSTSQERWTLMHQLKHIIDHFQPSVRTDADAEVVADHFAISVLMPAPLVFHAWQYGMPNPGAMARLFGVPLHIARHRLADLHLTPDQHPPATPLLDASHLEMA